ncbi:MAG: isochorismatase family protein [Candidatus Heimdallarchaeaceae archaeon]
MIKKRYFTKENCETKVKLWLEECEKTKSYKPFNFNPSTVALLVIDMQNYFLDENSHAFVPSSKDIIDNVQKLIKFMKQQGRPVYFTKFYSSPKSTDLMNRWWRNTVTLNSPDSEIFPFLDTSIGEVITKTNYSSFFNTDLERKLHEEKIEQILITGVLTHLCCETTARDAFMRNFEVFFLVDATASYNEDLHLGSLRAISHGFGICLSTEEIINEK